MALKKLHKETTLRGFDIVYEGDFFVCPICALEAGTVQTAGAVQRAIEEGYRAKMLSR